MNSLEQILLHALLVPMGNPEDPTCNLGLPMLLWGEPGIGKSARIGGVSKALGLLMEPVYPATRQPEDFSGVPVVNTAGDLHIECILGAVRNLQLFREGVLFIDEISCARPAVQASLLSLVLDRRVGDTVLDPRIRILLAANPPESAAGGWELEPPMANRLAHIDVQTPTVSGWGDYLMGRSQNALPYFPDAVDQVCRNWPSAWSKAASLMYAFMSSRPELLHALPKENNPARGRSWPSPRTWEFATRAVATCLTLDKDSMSSGATDLTKGLSAVFVEACVGAPAAVEWITWVAEADLPSPDDALNNKWMPEKRRLDRTIAVLGSVSGFVRTRDAEDDKHKYAVLAWGLINRVCDLGLLDLAMVTAEDLGKAQLGSTCKNKDVVAAAKPVILRIGKSKVTDFSPAAS